MPFDLAAYLSERFARVQRSEADLHPYQHLLVDFLHENPFSFALVDMGLGKTVSVLTLLSRLAEDFAFRKALIVAPIRVARQTWPTEIGLWRHTAGLSYSLIRAEDDDPEVLAVPPKQRTARKEEIRLAALRSPAPIHIINREAVEWIVERCGRKWPYDVLIVDESSSFRDHNAKRFRALAKVRRLVSRCHLLTATPATEGLMGLFAQTYLLDGGARFGTHITPFRERYFTFNPWAKTWKIRPGADEEIAGKIADIALVMKARDFLPLEEPKIIVRPVRLSPSQMARYREMEKNYVLELPSGDVIEAVNAGVLNGKLTQLASGAIYDAGKAVHHLHDHKIEELQQIVEEAQGQPILVGYWYQSSLVRLRKAFPHATVMDQTGKAVTNWNLGKIPMLLAHPMGAAHGLNLQAGGHLIAFFDLPWSYELYLQFICRLSRQGQQNPVRVYVISASDTVDETIFSALQIKENAQESLLARLRSLRQSMRRKSSSC